MYTEVSTQICQPRVPRINNTPAAMSTPSAWILVINTILQYKELGPLEEIDDVRTETGLT